MKRIPTFVLLTLLYISGHAQTEQNINSEDFPDISFVWNDYAPGIKSKSAFSVTENGKEHGFKVEHHQKKRNKSVLFLWEDMSYDGLELYNFTRKTLLEFFRETPLQSGDRFNISVFSRERNNANLLQPLVPRFTDSKSSLVNAVENYGHNTVSVSEQPKYSDLYKAIYQGIDLLNAEPVGNVKAIVVFTVGWNLQGGGAKSDAGELTNRALENHIPVYAALYPVRGTSVEIVTVAEDTYGETIDYKNAKIQLANFYKELNERHSPHEYRFTYATDKKKDGKLHNVVLSVNGKQQAQYSFVAPAFSFIDRAKENIWLLIGAGVAFIAVIAGVVIWLSTNRKKKDAAIEADLNRVRQEANAKAEEARGEAEQIKQQQRAFQQEEERKKRETEERSEQERLSKLMNAKNMYPRLQCVTGNSKFVYNVAQPVTAIGRNGANDLVLPNWTVSGKHAKIVFNGSGFEIFDLDSTNKVIVNGQFVKQTALKSGDIIGLGEAVITFYI
jgi:hypothetical protein